MATVKDYFAKLNRLRVNIGKPELKSWKASKDALLDAIDRLEREGALDVLPGAKVDAQPTTEDPEVKEALSKPAPEPQKCKSGLGRGLGNEPYARHSRKSVQDQRIAERKAEKKNKVKLSKAEKRAIKEEADARKAEDSKAERQKKHIAEKRAKRKAEGKAPTKKPKSDNEVTVADIARELNMSPKIARAKLRRHEDKLEKLHTKGQDRWTFPKSAASEIKKILK